MLDMEAIKNFSIDKSDWKKVKFGDVVFEPKESVKDPLTEGIEHVVGLEHISSEDMHLRRSASIEESTTFTKKFSKGDVLFGRRRAYLKKAAKASFEGICSGDITVMRAREELLLPELLPFIVSNDKFFDYAIKHSAGGLSPRVKFKDLANYELEIPTILVQQQILDIFRTIEKVNKKNHALENEVKNYFDSVVFDSYKSVINSSPSIRLVELLENQINNGVFKTKNDFGDGTLLVNVTDIYHGFYVAPQKLERVNVNEKEKKSFSAQAGDIIFNRSSLVADGIGHTSLIPEFEEDMVFECHLMRVRVNQNKVSPRFLCRYCLSPFGRKYLISRAQTTTMTTINQDALNKMPIPLPPLSVQIDMANKLDEIENIQFQLKDKKEAFKKVYKNIINKVF